MMFKKKHIGLAVGAVCLLLGSFVVNSVILAQTSSSGYDRWLDYNDDGVIDGFDLTLACGAYGTSGTPFPNKTGYVVLAYDSGWLNISDMQGQNITVTHNLNLAPETDFVQTIHGKMLPASDVHQTYFGGTGSAPGWNASYISGLSGPGGNPWGTLRSVVQTSDGGYAMAGWTWETGSIQLFWLVKTDSAGNHVWNRTYGGEPGVRGSNHAYSVVQTSDGGYALAGKVHPTDAAGPFTWPLLVKTDSEGIQEWIYVFSQGVFDQSRAYSVVQASDDGYVLAGYSNSTASGNYAFWLGKTNSTGYPQWEKTYEVSPESDAKAYSLIKTADGYAMAGYARGASRDRFCLVTVDASGNHQWNKTYISGLNMDYAYSLVQTADGGYALAGRTDDDVLLIKTDGSGNHQWNRTYSSGSNYDCAYSLVQTADGGYAMAGCANSTNDAIDWLSGVGNVEYADYWLVKTDSAGNMQWNRTFGDKDQYSEVAYSMVMTADGGFWIAGGDFRFPTGFYGWLIKTDALGLCDRADIHEVGLAVVATTANTLTLYRGRIDPYWNYVRVCIWVAKPSP